MNPFALTLAALLVWLARLISLVCHLVFRFLASRPLGATCPTQTCAIATPKLLTVQL